ncbi:MULTISPECIES: toxin-activating lysine-acyltransferase [unclassified Sphingomonas]|jgi:hemolysin-activating ACP:hemolysin acyltransferase|uniref:toxin-activating lysine-acyltransferase n=1 Tax=unclassified Sphingomonas TaxID=196159 RepID=UPI0009EA0C50
MHKHTYDKSDWYRLLGEAVVVLIGSRRIRADIATVGAFVWPYAQLSQISILYGRGRYPSGYITWGNLTADGIERLSQHPNDIPDIEDLNAGDNLVVFDIVSNLPSLRLVKAEIRHLLGPDRSNFYGIRYNRQTHRLTLRRYSFSPLSDHRWRGD